MRVLLLGGTGAMGAFLRGELAARGDEVVVTSRSGRPSEPGVSFVLGDAKDMAFLGRVLSSRYDAIVDFMTWTVDEFDAARPLLLAATGQYVFLSSYRVFAPCDIITESSPRLADVCPDESYRSGDEYAVVKAREEDALRSSGSGNWTIVRPAITYSRTGRFQLGTYEAGLWLWRALRRLPIPFPHEIADRECTLSRGQDVSRLISALVGNPRALGEDFIVSTSKHQPWSDVIASYQNALPFDVAWVSLADYEGHVGPALGRYGYVPQVRYDRAVDRILDNSKVIAATGIDEDSLPGATECLPSEFKAYLEGGRASLLRTSSAVQGRLDRLAGRRPGLGVLSGTYGFGAMDKAKYFVGRAGLA